jgi:hypothetical protein
MTEHRRFAPATRVLIALVLALPLVAIGWIVVGGQDAEADLENLVFTSRADHLRMIVPRGWRSTDQPSYPGLLLWMMRSQPEGQMVLTAEAFTRELYCTWPTTCRTSKDPLPAKYVCALRAKLIRDHFRVGPIQAGPKETEEQGLPTVWFEYDDGKHFLRQAVGLTADRAVSFVLAAASNDGRTANARPFEQALRTLRVLTPGEAAPAEADAGADVMALATTGDAALVDAQSMLPDAASLDAGVMFESAPASTVNPVGPCP